MIKKLIAHSLNEEQALSYFKYQLDETNTLCTELYNINDFKKGHFFTLLPDDADSSRKNYFEWGGILPQNPIEKLAPPHTGTFSWTPNIKIEISEFIFNKLRNNKLYSCIFDDTMRNKSDPNINKKISSSSLFFYSEEVYYMIKNKLANPLLIKNCLNYSNALWHSFGMITEAKIDNYNQNLTFENIEEICLRCQIIILRAYDGEGYVLWEKNQDL